MSDLLSVALVGCGFGAGINHAEGYSRADGAELVAVCDLDEERARNLGEEHDVPWYTDQETMQVDESPDLVSVATTEGHHVEPTITALETGADVFCEKIMAHSLSEGRRMVDAAERTGNVLGVNYNYRHMPVFERMHRAVVDGEIGDLSLATAEVHSHTWHHLIDLVRWLVGEPTSLHASVELDPEQAFWDYHDELLYVPSPTASVTMEFDDGTVATIDATWRTEKSDHLIDAALYGDDGRVDVTGITPENMTGSARPGPLRAAFADLPAVSLAESFHLSIQAFVDALRAGDRPTTTGEDGLAVMAIENAVVESDRERRWVDL